MIKYVEIVRDIARRTSEMYQEFSPDAKPVHFFADNYVQVGRELSIRGKSAAGGKAKYPAILLFTDVVPERSDALKQWDVEASIHIMVVDNAADGSGDMKREKVYYPILYPIYECFQKAIRRHPRIFTKGDALKFEKQDKYDLVAVIGKNHLFPDRLDGIDIRNLKLKIKEESCFTNKNTIT